MQRIGLVLAAALLCATAGGQAKQTPPLADAYNGFAFRMLQREQGTNVFLSPASIGLALGMTYNGAAGTTRTAIARVLGIASWSAADLNAANSDFLRRLMRPEPGVQITVANALWLRADFPPKPQFVRTNAAYFGAQTNTVDFAQPAAARAINAWVKQHTRGLIRNIVDRTDPRTVLFLTNAVAFVGKWSVPFDRHATQQQPFTTGSAAQRTVPMMHKHGFFRYAENAEWQAVELPYGKGRFAMLVVLPKTKGGLEHSVAQLTPAAFNQLTATLHQSEGSLALPRFTIRYAATLNDTLKTLGMNIAFSSRADFSNIHAMPPRLAISEVKHKTFLQVDETGTKAAGATSVGIIATAVRVPAGFTMVVDHPFLCAIVERSSNSLLFAGKIGDPTHSAE